MNKEIKKLFVAVKAFLVREDGKVLILSEAKDKDTGTNPGRFDFSGGKMDLGEEPQEALVREVKEETGLEIEIGKPIYINQWMPVVHGEKWQIIGIYFECKLKGDGEVKLSHEHNSFKWINPEKYEEYNLMDQPKGAFKKYLEK